MITHSGNLHHLNLLLSIPAKPSLKTSIRPKSSKFPLFSHPQYKNSYLQTVLCKSQNTDYPETKPHLIDTHYTKPNPEVVEIQCRGTTSHVADTHYTETNVNMADTHYTKTNAYVADTCCNEGESYIAESHYVNTNAQMAEDSHDRGLVSSTASPLEEEQEFLRSIINIAKSLTAETKLNEFLDPYLGRIRNKDFYSVIQLLGEEGLITQALNLLQWMRLQESSLLTPKAYSVLFKLLGNAGMPEKLWTLFKDMPDGKEFQCVNVYNQLIFVFSCCSRYDDAWKVFEEMEIKNIQPDSVTFSSLVTLMKKRSQNSTEIWQLFERTSRKGLKLSSEIFGSLIKSFCDDGLTKEALIVLSEMENWGFRPNVTIYNTLIDAYAKTNQLEEAEGMFLEMKDRHLYPTVSTYNVLIDAYSKKGRYGVVEDLIEEMEHLGLNPDDSTFTSLIRAYGKQNKMTDKATNVFLRMRNQGILPTCHSFSALIHAYSVSGWHEKAYMTFENMINEGIKPSLETYTTLLDVYRQAGDTEKLTQIWQMMTKDGIEETRVIFNILVDGFAKQGRCREARKIICEFEKKGLKPNVMTYNMLINAYARAGWHTQCPRVLNEMVAAGLKPDAYTYSTLIYAYFRVHDFKKAFYYHKEMIRNNQIPDSVSYKKMKALLSLKETTKNEREKKAVLAQIRKQMGLPSRNKHSKELWKNKKMPSNRVQTGL